MSTPVDELGVKRAQRMNLLTPEEAVTRQCREYGAIANNGLTAQWVFPPCSGPACMHWRWATVPAAHGEVTAAPPPTWGGLPTPATTGRGYCGRGGTP